MDSCWDSFLILQIYDKAENSHATQISKGQNMPPNYETKILQVHNLYLVLGGNCVLRIWT
jgi:hypothetical protein